MKAQLLADFVVECTNEASAWTTDPSRKSPSIASGESAYDANSNESSPAWTLQVDGASNSDDYGAGLILIDLEGHRLDYALRFLFLASNN